MAAASGALLVWLVGRDFSAANDPLPSQMRFVHLFSYNYKRAWPASLDLTGALWAATILGGLFVGAMAVPRVRRHAAVALTSFSLLFAAWGVDVYFAKIAPHWGQRDTVLAYYRAIQAKPGPLIAYQMNWKGENFYTSNHVAAFISSGKKFQDYVLEQKKKGYKTFYFLSEHSRTQTLQNELGSPKVFDKLTTPELDNKFVLVRATFE